MKIVKQIIPADHHLTRQVPKKMPKDHLKISEFFCDTIQGEGVYTGQPATFIRLSGCTLDCSYCDTVLVHKYGTPFSFKETFDLMELHDVPRKLSNGQHLVFTGGSPLMQQKKIIRFLDLYKHNYGFLPFIEFENECVIKPLPELVEIVKVWNNSPKLTNSGVAAKRRYKPKVIKHMSSLKNSWFKFVITEEEEWNEILNFYIEPDLIQRKQIILMPEGQTREEIEQKREKVIELCVRQHVRYSGREHIMVWGKQTGV